MPNDSSRSISSGQKSRPALALDVVRHHHAGFGAVRPEPDERHPSGSRRSRSTCAIVDSHQRLDAEVDRPSRKRECRCQPLSRIFCRMLADRHRQHRPKQVIEPPEQLGRGQPLDAIVRSLAVALLLQVDDDLRQVERQPSPASAVLGVAQRHPATDPSRARAGAPPKRRP